VIFWNSRESRNSELSRVLCEFLEFSRIFCEFRILSMSTEQVQPRGCPTRVDSENFGRRCGVSVGATASALMGNVQTPALTLAVEDHKALWVTTAGGNIVHIHHHHAAPQLRQRQDGPC